MLWTISWPLKCIHLSTHMLNRQRGYKCGYQSRNNRLKKNMEKKEEEVEGKEENCGERSFFPVYQISSEVYTPRAPTKCSCILFLLNKALSDSWHEGKDNRRRKSQICLLKWFYNLFCKQFYNELMMDYFVWNPRDFRMVFQYHLMSNIYQNRRD